MVVFHGAPFQRGYGIGSFFKSLTRRALPFLKQGVKNLGRAALQTGVNIAGDVLTGNSLKDSARSRARQTAQTLKEQAMKQVKSQLGSGQKPLKRKTAKKRASSSLAGKEKRAKAQPRKQPRKRKLPQIQGQVKKSKVNHLRDIWEK